MKDIRAFLSERNDHSRIENGFKRQKLFARNGLNYIPYSKDPIEVLSDQKKHSVESDLITLSSKRKNSYTSFECWN